MIKDYIFLLLIIASYSQVADAIHVAQICAAVRGNDFDRLRLLIQSRANLNEEDAFGRRPIFFVNHPEMARFLFANGALLATHVGSDTVHTDSQRRTPLHFLLGHTAPYLLRNARDQAEVIEQLEQTAYVILRAHMQEVGSRVLANRTRLENMLDGENNLPVTYLFNHPWTFNFIERMQLDHQRNYREQAIVLRDPARETTTDVIFGRSHFFTGAGSF